MTEQPCLTCAEVKKTEKQIKLEASRTAKHKEGVIMAQNAGADGFFMAVAKSGTWYIVELTQRPDSTLEWEYISVR